MSAESDFKDLTVARSNRIFETTHNEAIKLEERLHDLSLERTVKIIKELVYMHEADPNFSGDMMNQMKDFLADLPTSDMPEKNDTLRCMKLEALLATENSPYVEVRANVDPTDDPSLPCSTIRAWFIGVSFCCLGTFIDTLFAFRYPNVSIGSAVAQLVACEWHHIEALYTIDSCIVQILQVAS